jgi:hypothetical protein
MRDRSTWIVIGCYTAARLLLAVPRGPIDTPDTIGYREGGSFIGGSVRPWVLPWLFKLTPGDYATIVAQTVFSALAFMVLAAAVAAQMRSHQVRVAVLAIIPLLGTTQRITTWDAALLTESLTVSLTAALVATLIWWPRLPGWVLVGVVTLWLHLRDSHAMLGLLVVPLLVYLAVRHRRRAVAVCLVVVLAWAMVASQRDRQIEAHNVIANVAFRISYDPDRIGWFRDHGMPDSTAFEIADTIDRQHGLRDDPVFQKWAETDGVGVYLRYLAEHPSSAFGAIRYLFADDPLIGESMVDQTFHPYADTATMPFGLLWPNEGTVFTLLLAAGAALALLVTVRGNDLDRRWLIPTVLSLSTIPHGYLVFHGAPNELARHANLLAFVLVLSLWWMIALATDQALERREQPSPWGQRVEGGM